jgi:hypothetical protein
MTTRHPGVSPGLQRPVLPIHSALGVLALSALLACEGPTGSGNCPDPSHYEQCLTPSDIAQQCDPADGGLGGAGGSGGAACPSAEEIDARCYPSEETDVTGGPREQAGACCYDLVLTTDSMGVQARAPCPKPSPPARDYAGSEGATRLENGQAVAREPPSGHACAAQAAKRP